MSKDNKEMVQHLNTILRNELTAINQYFLHARILKHAGFNKLGDYEYKESIDEMKHADSIIDRILFLDGMPNLQQLGKLMIGENAKEMLECDLKAEHKAVADLRAAIVHAEKSQDFNSADLLRGILTSEEEHIDWLDSQLNIIKTIGIENYLQSQI